MGCCLHHLVLEMVVQHVAFGSDGFDCWKKSFDCYDGIVAFIL